jgi:hypothetical protein
MIFYNFLKNFFTLFKKENLNFPIEASEEEINCLNFCIPYTMTSVQRLYATLSSVKYIVNNNIEGDIVECGVWRGGNSMVIAKTLYNLDNTNRNIFLFDTFEGMTLPTDEDVDISGRMALTLLNSCDKKMGNNIWCLSFFDDVQFNIFSTGYPKNKIHMIKGDVLSTLKDISNIPNKISLLRLDTDWYESTKIELEVLFPLLVKGGVCIIDDYGHWRGARKAVDEYLAKHQIYPLINVTDYTGRIFIKN